MSPEKSSTERSPAAAVAELAMRLGRAMEVPGRTAREVAELVGGPVHDDGAPLGFRAQPAQTGVDTVAVTRRWGSEEPDTAEITLDPVLPLADLEAELGAARPVPRAPSGPRRVVLDAGGAGWTVLAALDDGGDGDGEEGDGVRSVTVRRDS